MSFISRSQLLLQLFSSLESQNWKILHTGDGFQKDYLFKILPGLTWLILFPAGSLRCFNSPGIERGSALATRLFLKEFLVKLTKVTISHQSGLSSYTSDPDAKITLLSS